MGPAAAELPSPGRVASYTAGLSFWNVVAAAVVLTGLNAAKPVHIDDPVYLTYAAEFAAHPLDPYGFQFGTPFLHPANDLLVPPVLPYWLGVGHTLFGDRPVVLKLWLFPFALTLTWAVGFLAARLAPSHQGSVVWVVVLSPTLLPGFNLMLEVPVLALGTAAVAAALRSVETDSLRPALLAGVLAGVAVQTKYTGAVAMAAVVVLLALHGRPARGVVAAAVAVGLVVGWEWFVARTQGESHFLIHVRQRRGNTVERFVHLVLPLVSHAAGLAPAVGLLGMTALGWARRVVLAAGLTVAAAVGVLVLAPSQVPLLTSASGKPVLTTSNLVYAALAVVVWLPVILVCTRLARRDGAGRTDRRLDWFLLAWLVLEVCGYFALSPYPAARRLTGVVLLLTFVVARFAHLRALPTRVVGRLAGCGVALSLLFGATDWLDARSAQTAARELSRSGYIPADGGTFWHLSWWGVGYYADREGLRPLQLNRELPRPGDLLAVHDVAEVRAFVAAQQLMVLERVGEVAAGDSFPLRVAPNYYDGRTPLEHTRGVRTRVSVYRITALGAGP